jgi:hypothetical protein
MQRKMLHRMPVVMLVATLNAEHVPGLRGGECRCRPESGREDWGASGGRFFSVVVAIRAPACDDAAGQMVKS